MITDEKMEIIISETKQVACDGGKMSGGHPRVFLTIGEENSVTCPYCSCLFKLKSEH